MSEILRHEGSEMQGTKDLLWLSLQLKPEDWSVSRLSTAPVHGLKEQAIENGIYFFTSWGEERAVFSYV